MSTLSPLDPRSIWLGTTVFRGKFCRIPRRHLPNSAAHRGKFLEFRGSPRPPTIESLCRLWPSYKFIIINSSTARIYWCKICNKIWINFSLFFVKTVILMTRDDWVSKQSQCQNTSLKSTGLCSCLWMDCKSQLQLQQQYRITEFGRSAEFPRIPWNSAETWKFRGNSQIPRLGSKFRGPRKTVVPSHQSSVFTVFTSCSAVFCVSVCFCM